MISFPMISIFYTILLTLIYLKFNSKILNGGLSIFVLFISYVAPEITFFTLKIPNVEHNFTYFIFSLTNHEWSFESSVKLKALSFILYILYFLNLYKKKEKMTGKTISTNLLCLPILKLLFWNDDYLMATLILVILSNLWSVESNKNNTSKLMSFGPWLLFFSTMYLMNKSYVLSGSTLLKSTDLNVLLSGKDELSFADTIIMFVQFFSLSAIVMTREKDLKIKTEISILKLLGVIYLIEYFIPLYGNYLRENINIIFNMITIIGFYPILKRERAISSQWWSYRHLLLLSIVGIIFSDNKASLICSLVIIILAVIKNLFSEQLSSLGRYFSVLTNVQVMKSCFLPYWIILYPFLKMGNPMVIIFWGAGIYFHFAKNKGGNN